MARALMLTIEPNGRVHVEPRCPDHASLYTVLQCQRCMAGFYSQLAKRRELDTLEAARPKLGGGAQGLGALKHQAGACDRPAAGSATSSGGGAP